MDIRFLNAEKFIDGIDILAEELSINISKNALKDYLDGKIDKIEDLEQPRLPYSTDVLNAFRWSQYEKFATFGNWGY